jgi:hypothetical protein
MCGVSGGKVSPWQSERWWVGGGGKFATSVNATVDKLAASVNETGGNLPVAKNRNNISLLTP